MYMFYCPRCGRFEEDLNNVYPLELDRRLYKRMTDYRGGRGKVITYYKCPDCDCLEAGSMINTGDKDYFKTIVTHYHECCKDNNITMGGITIIK